MSDLLSRINTLLNEEESFKVGETVSFPYTDDSISDDIIDGIGKITKIFKDGMLQIKRKGTSELYEVEPENVTKK